MIKDWTKYEAYRERLMNGIRPTFSSIDDNAFYDLFQDAYLEKFPVFEHNFDAAQSENELGFLYRLVVNKIIDLLKKQPSPHFQVEMKGNDSYEDIDYEEHNTTLSFADFLFKIVTHRGGLKNTDSENKKAINKHYKIVTPLIRMEAWAQKETLTEELLHKLSGRITSDVDSEQFYDWIEPTPIVRLKSWVGCS